MGFDEYPVWLVNDARNRNTDTNDSFCIFCVILNKFLYCLTNILIILKGIFITFF